MKLGVRPLILQASDTEMSFEVRSFIEVTLRPPLNHCSAGRFV